MSRNESPLWKSIESLPPRADGDFRYGLINQSAFADRMKCIEALKVFNRCALLDQPLEGCVDRATPFLIAMDVYLIPGAKAQALINFCNEACYGSALSILDSPLSIQELAETLTQRCDVVLSDGSEVMLRYFDARVMDWLMDALEPTQLASFVSCATVWRYAGREGVLEWAAAPAGVEKLAFSPPLHLSRIQTIALRDAGIADAVLDILTRSNLQQLLETPYPFRYPLVQRLITAARNWNLGGKSDLVAYCTVAIESGPDFDQLPPWDQLMPKVKNGEISFTQALVMAEEHSI